MENTVDIKISLDVSSDFDLQDDDIDQFHKKCLPKVEFQIFQKFS